MKDPPAIDRALLDEPPRVQLTDAVAGTGAFASELVHALRGPVATLRMSLDLLATTTDPEDLRTVQGVVKRELERLTGLMGRTQALTELAAPLVLAPGDLAAMLRARLDELAPACAERGITLTAALPERAVPVRAAESALAGVFDALLANALEALGDGGALTVTLAAGSASAVCSVHDTGSGIPAPALSKVTRVFYTTKPGAAGLGLSVARQVLTAHGATLTLASEPGSGTTATVRLPLAR